MKPAVNLKRMQKVYRQASRLLALLPTAVEQWLYPPLCTLCDAAGTDGVDLCAGCHGDMPWNRHACLRCALPLPITSHVDGAGESQAPVVCGRCLKAGDSLAYDQAWACLVYADPLPWLVTQLKFHQRLNHARLLADLMWRQLRMPLSRQAGWRPDVIVPVPLHSSRLRQRGYNQALEIARPLAKRSGIPLDKRSLKRIRATEQQSGLPVKKRRRNLRNAFACGTNLQGRHVVLVDDVMTSGNTVQAASKALKKAGATTVTVWVAARTPQAGMQGRL